MALKWWQTVNLVERDTSRAMAGLDWLAEQREARRRAEEEEERTEREKRAALVERLTAQRHQTMAISQLETAQIPITGQTVGRQVESGFRWADEMLRQAKSERALAQAGEWEKEKESIRKEAEKWAKYMVRVDQQRAKEKDEASLSWNDYSPAQQEAMIDAMYKQLRVGQMPEAVPAEETSKWYELRKKGPAKWQELWEKERWQPAPWTPEGGQALRAGMRKVGIPVGEPERISTEAVAKAHEPLFEPYQAPKAKIGLGKEIPTISLEDFDKQYFAEKGWEYDIHLGVAEQKDINLHDYRVRLAHKEYEKRFGKEALEQGQIGRGLSFVFAPARAIRPEVKWEDIRPVEKILGVGQIALYAIGPIGGVVPGVAGSALRMGATGVSAAAFSTATAMEWENLSPAQRVIYVGFDALLWAGFAYQMGGVRSDIQAAKGYYKTPLAKEMPDNLKGTAFETRCKNLYVEACRVFRKGDRASLFRAQKLYRQIKDEIIAKGYAPKGGWEPYTLAATGTATEGNPTTALIVRNVNKMKAASAIPKIKIGGVVAEEAVKAGNLVKVTTAPVIKAVSDIEALVAKGWVYNKPEETWYKPAEAEVAKPVMPTAEVPTPVKGEQVGMLGVPGKVVTQRMAGEYVTAGMDDYAKLKEAMEAKGRLSSEDAQELTDGLDLKAEQIGDRIDRGSAELEAMESELDPRIARLTEIIPETKEGAGELLYITKGDYRILTGGHYVTQEMVVGGKKVTRRVMIGGEEPKAGALSADKKHVRWEYALDKFALELGVEEPARAMGMAPDEYLKNLIEQAKRTKESITATRNEIDFDKGSLKNIDRLRADIESRVSATTTGPLFEAVSETLWETGTYTPGTVAKAGDWVTDTDGIAEVMGLGVEKATAAQIKRIHALAAKKKYIDAKGVMKPQYRRLAKGITGKTSAEKMTQIEASRFIEALEKLPEPTVRGAKVVPPSIPVSKKITVENFFGLKFGQPTIIGQFTSQTYYAEQLGVKPLVEPLELGKQRFDLEYRAMAKEVANKTKQIDKLAKTSFAEKLRAKRANEPTKAVARMRDLLDKYEEAPTSLTPQETEVFNWFRNLNRTILNGENQVRALLDLEPIPYRKAYVRHIADGLALDMLMGKYPFPEGLKYWSQKVVGKKIFNPMEMRRELAGELEKIFTKDLRYATQSMLWTGLKAIHLSQPLQAFTEQMGALSKDLPRYEGISAEELDAIRGVSVMPASTKKWVTDYVNQVIKGQQTDLDAMVDRLVTETGLEGIFNKILRPFGRTVGLRPLTHFGQFTGRLVISGVMGAGRPKQIIRNLFQNVQNLALYGVKPCLKGFLPADKQIQELLDKSLFLKGYTGFEELPTELQGKLEKVWLAPYGHSATFNAKTAMKAAYWDTKELITQPKYKKYGWADPQRTYTEAKDVLYDSEKDKLFKEMEFGAGCTQYQYIPLGMPELFRHKALVPLTRLQSWWMNYFFKFNREAIYRLIKGETSYGAKLPWSRRIGWLRYLFLGGTILNAMGYKRSFMIGVLPHWLSPAAQLMLGILNYVAADNDWQKKKAENQMKYSWKAFIPGSAAWRDWDDVWTGKKPLKSLFFYGDFKESEEPKSGAFAEGVLGELH